MSTTKPLARPTTTTTPSTPHRRIAAAAATNRFLSPAAAKRVLASTVLEKTPLKRASASASASAASTKKLNSPRSSTSLNLKQKSSQKETPKRVLKQYDRYIPNRQASDLSNSHFHLAVDQSAFLGKDEREDPGDGIIPKKPLPPLDPQQIAYQEDLARACGIQLNSRILSFQPPAPVAAPGSTAHLLNSVLYRGQHNGIKKNNSGACHISAARRRRIQTTPERVLDAPGILDDYYLNLLDWSAGNQLAVALEGTVYVWDGETGDVVEFCKANELETSSGPEGVVCSVQWTADGDHLSIGLGDGSTQIWDLATQTKLRTLRGHTSRVGVLAWDRHILSTGSRDGSIWNHDVRIARHKVNEYNGHTQEVCGLKWRSDGGMLASGGNDNLVNLWDVRNNSAPRSTKTAHNAAVKAVAWCPWQLNLLATGGGTNDKKIHFWNTTTASTTPLQSIDTGSQVTSLLWSKTYKELISTHGYPFNQLSIWAYPSCKKVVDLEGHDARVLCSAMSPDGSTVVSGAGDESLKFWKAFERVGGGGTGSSVGGGVGGEGKAGGMVKGAGEDGEDELVNATKKMTIR